MNWIICNMIVYRAVLLAILAGGVAGCLNTRSDVANLGKGVADKADPVSKQKRVALKGGILPKEVFAALPEAAQTLALNAEFQAHEDTPSGVPVEWKLEQSATAGTETSGSVRATQPYRVGSSACRQYSHSVVTGGQNTQSKGAACRNADGSWTPLR